MTEQARKARRRQIVKRVAAMKISATWKRKRALRGDPEEPPDDSSDVPEADTMLDGLLDSLVG